MKKFIAPLALTLCINGYAMPSYKFYEEFSNMKTVTSNSIHSLFMKNKPNEVYGNGKNEYSYIFKMPKSLVNNKNFFKDKDYTLNNDFFLSDAINTTWGFINNKYISVSFNGLIRFNRNHFYKIFNLIPSNTKISQMKYSCSGFEHEAFYEITLNNEQKLYLIEVNLIDTSAKYSFTSLDLYNKKVTCQDLDWGKPERKFGNPKFK